MGSVYLARDLRLERDVAVKTLTGLSVWRLMGLKPEAWAMAAVAHPAVAQIHGVESWRGRPFLVVEFLAGGTLADRLRHGPLPAPEAVSVAETLAAALGALHETGYLHGDVKASNVGLTENGSPKLLDFGLARGANDAAARGRHPALPVAGGAVGPPGRGRPTTSGLSASSCTKWRRASTRSPATTSTTSRIASGASGSVGSRGRRPERRPDRRSSRSRRRC